MLPQIDLGARIRSLRKERGVTLAVMAENTGLSLGYLSKLENDLTSPTIAHLHKICEALGLTINDILLEEPEVKNVTLVRTGERAPLLRLDDGGLQFYSLTKGHTILQGTSMTINSDEVYCSEPHTHDELGIVATGVLEIFIDDQSYRLLPGDTIYIRAGTMHSSRRATPEVCISYWIKTVTSVNAPTPPTNP